MNHHRTLSIAVVLLALVFCGAGAARANAHTGGVALGGLAAGAAHPLTGLDHLLAMFAVGLWAAQCGGRMTWRMPMTFLTLMAVGGALGMAHVALPSVEPAIVASVLVLGMLVATAVTLPWAASAMLIGACALVHGHAHGSELPANAVGWAYDMGFLASTAGLILAGVALATLWQRAGATAAVRIAGGAIAACGLFLCLA